MRSKPEMCIDPLTPRPQGQLCQCSRGAKTAANFRRVVSAGGSSNVGLASEWIALGANSNYGVIWVCLKMLG